MEKQNQNDLIAAAEHMYKAWDEALGAKDLEAALALYTADASIESPLVVQLLAVERGICQGHDQLRRFKRSSGSGRSGGAVAARSRARFRLSVSR